MTGEPILGLFHPENKRPAASSARTRLHYLGFVNEQTLASAKRLAADLGLSLSSVITDAVRERVRVREEARREAARKVVASFALEERSSPEEARALLELWSTPSGPSLKRMKDKW